MELESRFLKRGCTLDYTLFHIADKSKYAEKTILKNI